MMISSKKLCLGLLTLSLSLLLLPGVLYSENQALESSTQDGHQIIWQAIVGGGGFDTTANYQLLSVLAQPIAGITGTGNYYVASGFVSDSSPTPLEVVDIESPTLPKEYTLSQNYPNPFNPTTTIEFALPRSGFVSIEVYDIMGRKVIDLVSEDLQAGVKRVDWDGRDRAGAEVASGVYFYRIQVNDFSETRKMLLLK
jgi:hypothetical protein